MFIIRELEPFIKWFRKLKDSIGRARIMARIESFKKENLGDHKSIGDGVFELRISVGPGYRIYYAQEERTIYLLLIGGDKSSQEHDIQLAKQLWVQYQEKKNARS